MKAFKPPTEGSISPPEHLAPSMAAFSQLKRPQGQGTDVMADRPRIEVPKITHFTEALANRVVAAPPTSNARATQDEAGARTQYGDPPEMSIAPNTAVTPGPGVNRTRVMPPGAAKPAGVSTDLGASRDTTQSTPAPEPKKPNVMAFAIGAVVLMALGAGAVVTFAKKDPTTTGSTGTPSIATAPETPPSANFTPPPPPSAPPSVSAAPSASVSVSVSVSASASALKTPVTTKPPPTTTTKPVPTLGAGLGTKEHE
jgi:hypothetical protein